MKREKKKKDEEEEEEQAASGRERYGRRPRSQEKKYLDKRANVQRDLSKSSQMHVLTEPRIWHAP